MMKLQVLRSVGSLSYNNNMFLESYFAIMLYGIIIAQAYVYLFDRKRDALLLQFTVLTVVIIETIHTGLIIQSSNEYILGRVWYGATWSESASVLLGVLVETIVQAFYVWRVYISVSTSESIINVDLNAVRHISPAGATMWDSCRYVSPSHSPPRAHPTQLGFGFTITGTLFRQKEWIAIRYDAGSRVIMSLGIGAAAVTDVVTTGILVYHLHKNRTGIKETDHIIKSIMMYFVHTGAITTLCLVIVLILTICPFWASIFCRVNVRDIVERASLEPDPALLPVYANSFLGSCALPDLMPG
ncbi:hypothetical protein NLI96_g2374 [Meripilus lineatus]|uniref:DUF6534 domain-containing protein n=1 Tax=Meripilus lineatus TaxID=2056292 RepID=A0AAD5VE77_9APHY|nr:hypothetical protein NLI96_g2374 [Physisporinus lineatus]